MADIKIDEAKALIWIADVKDEISRVEALLEKVSTESATTPGEKDTIFQGIATTCENLHSFFTSMCDRFKNASETIKNNITKIGTTVGTIVDDIGNVKNRIGQQ